MFQTSLSSIYKAIQIFMCFVHAITVIISMWNDFTDLVSLEYESYLFRVYTVACSGAVVPAWSDALK